jgi:hypothetical protein
MKKPQPRNGKKNGRTKKLFIDAGTRSAFFLLLALSELGPSGLVQLLIQKHAS